MPRRPNRRTAPARGALPQESYLMARSGNRQGSSEPLTFFNIFFSLTRHEFTASRCSGDTCLSTVRPSQLRGPGFGADPRACCTVRGGVFSKVVRLAFIPTQINEEPKIIFFNLLYFLFNRNSKINWSGAYRTASRFQE